MRKILNIITIGFLFIASCKNVDLDLIAKEKLKRINQLEAIKLEREKLENCYKNLKMGLPNIEKECNYFEENEIKAMITKCNLLFDSIQSCQINEDKAYEEELSEKKMNEVNNKLNYYGEKGFSFELDEVKEIVGVIYGDRITSIDHIADSIAMATRAKDSMEAFGYIIDKNVKEEEEELQIPEITKADILQGALDYEGKYEGKFGSDKILISFSGCDIDGNVNNCYNIYKGKTTKMTGTFTGKPNIGPAVGYWFYDFTLNEPKGSSNGTFVITFDKSGVIKGTWKSYNGKITREFELDYVN